MDADPLTRRRAARHRHRLSRAVLLVLLVGAAGVGVGVTVAVARHRRAAELEAETAATLPPARPAPAAPAPAPKLKRPLAPFTPLELLDTDPPQADPEEPPRVPTTSFKGSTLTIRGVIVGRTMRMDDLLDFGLGEGDGKGEGVLVVRRAKRPDAYCYFPRSPGAAIPGVPATGLYVVTVTGVVDADNDVHLVLQNCRLVSISPVPRP
jgi:hypothetical protein